MLQKKAYFFVQILALIMLNINLLRIFDRLNYNKLKKTLLKHFTNYFCLDLSIIYQHKQVDL